MTTDSKPGTGRPTVLIDNDRVRVTEWRFAKRGDNTGWHRHAHDYVMVPLFDGHLEIDTIGERAGEGAGEGVDERTLAPMQNGVPYFREAGVEHDVINGNDFECAFIEIEIVG